MDGIDLDLDFEQERERESAFHNPKQATIDATKSFLRTFCESKHYVTEVFGSEADLNKFRKLVSKVFKEPKATPAGVQRGMVHVRVKRLSNQHAGDIFVGQFNSLELLK
jgi:hypothetical protein